MYYGKEKLHGKVVSILVYLGITYKNENKITTCFPTQIKKVEYVWIEWTILNMDWTFLV